MDARIRHRRARVARERGHRRAAVAVILVLAAAVAGGVYWLGSSDSFAVRRVVVPKTAHVTPGQMQAALASATGSNLLRVSTEELERRVGTIAYVRSARVLRRFPDALEVRVEEYRPRALVRATDGSRWIVADDGRVLEEAKESAVDLPLLVPSGEVWPQVGGVIEPRVVDALPVLARLDDPGAWPADRHPVGRIEIASEGEVTVVLAGGAELRLGEPVRLDDKFTVALAIIERYLREGRSIAYIDVGEPSRVVVRAR